MKNDFKRKHFYTKVDSQNIKTYYILINRKWIQISKEIYAIYQCSYKRVYREQQKEYGKLIYYENIDDMYPYIYQKNDKDVVYDLYMKDLIERLYQALKLLSQDELKMIYMIYFFDLSERHAAKYLGISKTTVHYRKTIILKKLRDLLDHFSK